jgi:hypothetical protein
MHNQSVHFRSVESVPERFETDEFVLRPIEGADTPLDYRAVMATREFLVRWEQTGWPAEDFTEAEDLADVEGLERRHRERDAFTYTVMATDGAECLGCVYLMPPDARDFADATITPLGRASWSDIGALVYLWVRSDRLADGLDARLLATLRSWLSGHWQSGPVLFVTNEQLPEQVATLERAGLTPRFRYAKPGQPAPFVVLG